MPGLRGLGFFAWLALMALLVLFEAMRTWRWEVPVFTLTVLSLPATLWACLSRPVRGRPLLGFVLGLLNYLAFPASFNSIVDLLHGWAPSPVEILLSVAFFIAFVVPYSLGAALVASSGEGRAGGERAVYGFALAFASWLLTIMLTFFTG